MKLYAIVPFFLLAACGRVEAPSAADGVILVDHASTLLKCQNVGREAGTYAAYEACKKDAGVE